MGSDTSRIIESMPEEEQSNVISNENATDKTDDPENDKKEVDDKISLLNEKLKLVDEKLALL